MKVVETGLPGCVVIEPAVWGDARGFFYEAWNAERFGALGLPTQCSLAKERSWSALSAAHLQKLLHGKAGIISLRKIVTTMKILIQ